MKHWLTIACAAALATIAFPRGAHAGKSDYDALVAAHAQANHVPEALVHRVIQRESRYQPQLIGRGGTIGLMQIKLATAKGLGYTGDAEGLREPNTNLTYGVKYLAGAYRAAEGDHERAMHFYAAGYYYTAKRQRLAGGKRSEAAVDERQCTAKGARKGCGGGARQGSVAAIDHPRRCKGRTGALTAPAIGLH